MALSKTSMFIGQCLPCLKANISKFKVTNMVLDVNLKMYFPEHQVVYAYDPKKMSKSGDYVLIEKAKVNISKDVEHNVLEVVYACGDITDPITGKKLIGNKYRDELEGLDELYGKKSDGYDYKSAPERGWQENKKDFSHLETYTKYDANDTNPNAI